MNLSRLLTQRRRWVLVPAAVVLVAVAIAVVRLAVPSRSPASAYGLSPTPTPATGTLLTVERAQLRGELELRGRMSPINEAYLVFPMEGWLKEVYVTLGQEVQQGELLAELDAWELESQLVAAQHTLEMRRLEISRILAGPAPETLAVAQAQVERAQVDLERIELEAAQSISQRAEAVASARLWDASPDLTAAEVGLERAKMALDAAQDAYNQSLDRPWQDQALRDVSAIQLRQAQLDYRVAQAAAETAKLGAADRLLRIKHAQADLGRGQKMAEQESAAARADLVLAKARLDELTQPPRAVDLDILRAQVAEADVDVKRMQARLDASRVYAPFNGTVFALDAQVGDRIQAYAPIGTVGDATDVQVLAYVFEQDIGGVDIGQSATVVLDSYPDSRHAGQVQLIAARAVTWQGRRAYPITIVFRELDEVPPVLRTGCDVYIDAGTQLDVLTIPSSALYTAGGLTYVDTVENGTVRRTPVRIGTSNGDLVEVVSGLREGQTVRVR